MFDAATSRNGVATSSSPKARALPHMRGAIRHLAFETFLEWINDMLANARWPCFYVDEASARFVAADLVCTQIQRRKLHWKCCVFLPVYL